FTDAVKAGDSGRVVIILKVWALSFRGNGRTKYAYEMLHLIHNLSNVWPKAVRDIVMNNWLLNPTGRPNSFVEVDLVQEHMNYWIKVSSWEWLEMVAPCVEVLRHLSKVMSSLLGSNLGTRHEPMDLTRDIPTLMASLKDHEVYEVKRGRVLDEDDPPVTDVVAHGLQALTDSASNPLSDFNFSFTRLQARRRLKPIVGAPSPGQSSASASAPPPESESSAVPSTPSTDGPSSGNSRTPQATAALAERPGSTVARSKADDNGTENVDESDDDNSEAGEFERSADDELEETLTRENAEDVSLDMDAEDMLTYNQGQGEALENDWDVDSVSSD
ncbi:hypothetical protein BV22DRAFT_983924, partial [Leucogyrophana mollusca]